MMTSGAGMMPMGMNDPRMAPIAMGWPQPQPSVPPQQPSALGTRISTSVGYISKIPKTHLVDGIASVEASIDSTLTGHMEAQVLCVIIWLLTRIQPDFQICSLRVGTYEDVCAKFVTASERTKDWT
jgi:hypothetical protein